MKRIIILILFVITVLTIKAQKSTMIDLQNSDIIGRWIETERIAHDQQKANELQAIFVFKADSAFHKGSEVGNVIIFTIAGNYTVKNDSINISYFDFSNKQASGQRLRKMWMRVVTYSKDEMKVQIGESKYKKYEVVLKRKEF